MLDFLLFGSWYGTDVTEDFLRLRSVNLYYLLIQTLTLQVISIPYQGSNLALANLLNAILFLACKNKSLSYEPNYATQHALYGKQCRS